MLKKILIYIIFLPVYVTLFSLVATLFYIAAILSIFAAPVKVWQFVSEQVDNFSKKS